MNMNHLFRLTTTRIARRALLPALILLAVALASCTDGPEQVASEPTDEREPASSEPTAVVEAAATDESVAVATAASSESGDEAAVESLPATNTPQPTPTADNGALIQMSFASQVGILIDGVPADLRQTVIDNTLAQSEEQWLELAKTQVRLTRLRLNFRGFGEEGVGQLPLTPEQIWNIELDPAGPQLGEVDGHELILLNYTFDTTILTDVASPGNVEPMLAETGGTWIEPFVFPADPTLLTQRTGNACINEAGFPPNSYDSQNYWYLYDFECTANSGGALGCHRDRLPNFSCQEALDIVIGSVETDILFERLAWDPDLADRVRLGPNNPGTLPDLEVVDYELDINRVLYAWFPPEDCALLEGAVNASGWRRILQFNATVYNISNTTLEIGRIANFDPMHHVFEYSPCHDHFHYSNYGSFDLVDVALPLSSKKAFCVQSTSRFSNNESSPLDHEYSCSNQGIQAGWVDEYIAGLDVQWVDITDMDIPEEGRTVTLGFSSNADGFICEGSHVLDDAGEWLWEPTGFFTEDGNEINRPVCDFTDDWERNNYAETEVFVEPVGSYVTQACTANAFGPLRDCGYSEIILDDVDNSCVPGETVALQLPGERLAERMVLRVCEMSAMLGGLACDFRNSLLSTPVTAAENSVSFTCPAVRDGAFGTGGYSLYMAPYIAPLVD